MGSEMCIRDRVRWLRNIPTKRYPLRRIPNPYATPCPEGIQREDIFALDDLWTGDEVDRPGRAEFRDRILERNGSMCAVCKQAFPAWELELDHIKPREAFKRANDADVLANFQLLCTPHHRAKTKADRQVLSRVR